MNDRTFKSSKWLVGTAGRITLLTLISGFSVLAQTTLESAPTNSPSLPPSAEASAVVAPEIPEDLSPGLAEVVKLIQARVGDDVILAYIKNSAMVYHPTADEILYLNDLGVSDAVLTALLEHNREGSSASTNQQGSATPEPASQAPTPSSQATVTGAPAPTYSVSSSPEVVTAAPPSVVAAPAPVPAIVAAPATTVVVPPSPDVVYFQDSLSPYGTWVYVDGSGWCWQPTVVVANPTWAPYCDRGRWIYSDCGWYWESDYSWGWAPFHYGRWWRHDHYGWVWCPDRVWGPAWVTWRHHDNYCGWAPLPPAARFEVGVGLTFHNDHVGANFGFGLSAGSFTFVAYDHFCDPHPGRYRVPHHEVGRIYNHSTVINNYTVVNKTIINEGVGRERVSRLSHQPIRPVSVRPMESRPSTGRAEHLENGGKTLSVYRPPMNVPRASSPSVAAVDHRVRINHPSQPTQGGPQAGQGAFAPGAGRSHGDPNNNGSRGTTVRTDNPVSRGNPGNREPGGRGNLGNRSNPGDNPAGSGNLGNPGRSGQSGNRNDVRPSSSATQAGNHGEVRPSSSAAPRTFTPPQTQAGARNPMPVSPTQNRSPSIPDSGRSYTPVLPSQPRHTEAPARTELPTSSAARPASREPMASPPSRPEAPSVRPAPSHSSGSESANSAVRPERFGNGNRPY